MPEDVSPPDRRSAWLIAAAVVAITICYIIGSPRSAGPDEPSHMVASAGLVRGDRDGIENPANPAEHLFEVPEYVGNPNPGCWALNPYAPVNCAVWDSSDAPRASTSFGYPPWGFVLPGLASFIDWPGASAYFARAASAALAVALVIASLLRLRRRHPLLAVGAALSLTPITWFTFGVVSPSAVAIAGGLALWTGLLTGNDESRNVRCQAPDVTPNSQLAVAGWVALLLLRRDGPVWATLIVAILVAATGVRPLQIWRRLGRVGRVVVLVAPLVPLVNAFIDRDTAFNVLLTLVPLALIGVELWARWWPRLDTTLRRVTAVGGIAVVAAAVLTVVLRHRPGGMKAEVVRLVVGATGEHLRQLVGVLGWLDAPVPWVAVFVFWACLGGLALIAAMFQPRLAIAALGALLVMITVAWILELGQGSDYGAYWQGRYSMPFAVGFGILAALPITEAGSRLGASALHRLGRVIAGAIWLIWNLGFLAAQQRWAVGQAGSYLPWQWDTWGSPLPPIVICAAHGVASAALLRAVTRSPRSTRPAA